MTDGQSEANRDAVFRGMSPADYVARRDESEAELLRHLDEVVKENATLREALDKIDAGRVRAATVAAEGFASLGFLAAVGTSARPATPQDVTRASAAAMMAVAALTDICLSQDREGRNDKKKG